MDRLFPGYLSRGRSLFQQAPLECNCLLLRPRTCWLRKLSRLSRLAGMLTTVAPQLLSFHLLHRLSGCESWSGKQVSKTLRSPQFELKMALSSCRMPKGDLYILSKLIPATKILAQKGSAICHPIWESIRSCTSRMLSGIQVVSSLPKQLWTLSFISKASKVNPAIFV